jgi:hypothetical protein
VCGLASPLAHGHPEPILAVRLDANSRRHGPG